MMIADDPYRKPITYSAGFFMLIAFAVGGMIFGGFLGGIIWMLTTGKGFQELAAALGNPAYLRQMQLIQTISAVCGFFLPAVITAALLSRKPLRMMGFEQKPAGRQVLFALLIILAGLGISSGLGYLSYQLPLPQDIKTLFDKWENQYAVQAAGLVSFKNIPDLIISILVLALIPAVCEEAFFRGGLQNFLYRSKKNLWFSVIVVSFIFSVVHLSGYGFLSRFALGIILGLLYQFTGNIWLNILAHFINNALAMIVLYTQVQAGKSVMSAMNDRGGTYLGLLAVPVVVLLFILFKKRTEQTVTTNGI
ncbi:MAG: CPBP family intramembrane metalloprotease [Niabella sp.]|nr:CPBP family intramembrane metalloprotease [Niabella sp.]